MLCSFPDADSNRVKRDRESGSGDAPTHPVTPSTKRRVTFSNEVSACPPPGGRDSKKVLSEEQKTQMAEMAREFLAGWNAAENASLVKANTSDMPKGICIAIFSPIVTS
uniref:Uncharacterized protein n=1 Tax=Parascaris equorum TaxID=6256 RepID=A0A914R8V5_PAREQ